LGTLIRREGGFKARPPQVSTLGLLGNHALFLKSTKRRVTRSTLETF
jgi:hypothetical protein